MEDIGSGETWSGNTRGFPCLQPMPRRGTPQPSKPRAVCPTWSCTLMALDGQRLSRPHGQCQDRGCQHKWYLQIETKFVFKLNHTHYPIDAKAVLWQKSTHRFRTQEFILDTILENFQALLWWIFQPCKFLWEKATFWITLTFWNSSSKNEFISAKKTSNGTEFQIVLSSCVLRRP